MHRGDGEYLLRKLKSRASTKAIPVLVISGIADQRRKAQAQMMGASSVLCKPVRFEVLLDALSQHLDLENPGDEDEPKAHIRLKNKVLRIDGNHQRMEPNFNGGLEPQ
jgi:DNA-binding response OmpR family regulator